jgi:glutaredoxin domain-containing cysteine-rich protein 1
VRELRRTSQCVLDNVKLWTSPPPPPPDSERKAVLYLTSLRGIRKTYEDCWSTRSVLQGCGVRVDERDLSMHAGFKDELHAALGGAAGRLPQVFADGRHIGGAEEVRRMHEAGELEACEMAPPGVGPGKGVAMEACSGCGGVRFVPCEECSGSCKVFLDEVGSFRRCPECYENGLARCPLCSL